MPLHKNDAYVWRVLYEDDTSLSEFDEVNTIGRGFAEVDQSRVKQVQLLDAPNGNVRRTAHVPTGAQPVFFRRRRVSVNVVSEASEQRPTVHCIGWKRGEDAVYLFVFDDGTTLLSSDLQAG